jgi:hypothetical protein
MRPLAEFYRLKAAQCRELAAGINYHPETTKGLRAMARALETSAKALEEEMHGSDDEKER